MNTPSHLALSLLIWRKTPSWALIFAVALGALLPDLPMIGFYAWEKLNGVSEAVIWDHHYHHAGWQLFFDWFNALPLYALLAGLGWLLKLRWLTLLALSALAHLVLDFPLHHDDAHRHFLPFSDYRFFSPVSYWDARYYGRWAMAVELVFTLAASVFVAFKVKNRPARRLAQANLLLIGGFIAFAVVMWGDLD